MTRAELHVPTMSCDHCRAAIEGSVGSVAGVSAVAVDLGAKRVTVVGTFAQGDVLAAIADAGYEVVDPA